MCAVNPSLANVRDHQGLSCTPGSWVASNPAQSKTPSSSREGHYYVHHPVVWLTASSEYVRTAGLTTYLVRGPLSEPFLVGGATGLVHHSACRMYSTTHTPPQLFY